MPDGNDIADVASAIEEAQKEDNRPSLILCRTHIGYGSPKKQDSFEAHGSPLGEDELQAAKKALGWPTMEKFFLPPAAVDHFREALGKGAEAQTLWKAKFATYKKENFR